MRAIGTRCVHADPVPNAAVLVQLFGTVASEPSSSGAGLGLKQLSLPTVMLGQP
jgi:hypothetical protein